MAGHLCLYEEPDFQHTDIYMELPTYELLQEQLSNKFVEQVILAMDNKTSKLRIKGSPSEMESAAKYITSSSESIAKHRCDVNIYLQEFLQSTDLAQLSQKNFKDNGINAVCASDGNAVHIWSQQGHREKADAALKNAVKSWPFPLNKEHARIASGEGWSRFFEQLEQKFSGNSMNSCKFTVGKESEESLAYIYIAGDTRAVYEAEAELANFFEQHTDGETPPAEHISPSAQGNSHEGLKDGPEFRELQNSATGSSSLNDDYPLYATGNKQKQLQNNAEYRELQSDSVDNGKLNDKDDPLYAEVNVNERNELEDSAEFGELRSGSVDNSSLYDNDYPLHAKVNKHNALEDGARLKELGNGYVEIKDLIEGLSHAQVNKHSGDNGDERFRELPIDSVDLHPSKRDPLYENVLLLDADKCEPSTDAQTRELHLDAHLTPMNPILKESLLFTKILVGGRFLHLHIGDMVIMPVDAMVNAANDCLDHKGGIAEALSDAAGPGMQRESYEHIKQHGKVPFGYVAMTGPGRLPCKKVFHVVGPNWRNRENNADNGRQGISRLNMTVVSALEAADKEGFNSIALPAISSGVYGFPLPLCARTIYKAILVYCEKTQHSMHTLTDIHIVDIGDAFVMEILNLAQENDDVIQVPNSCDHLSTTHGHSEIQFPQNEGFVSDEETHRRRLVAPIEYVNEENIFVTSEGITISILTGRLEDQTTDVTVNTLPPSMDVNIGSVSSALAQKGGPDLQAAVNKTKTLFVNDHVETEPTGALSCKRVYHVILQLAYKDTSSENYNKLNKAVFGCLKRAHKARMKSISFPVMGSGKHRYPLQEVARCMLHAAKSFSEQYKTTTLQLIQIVTLASDSDVLPMFQREIFSMKNSSQRSPNNQGRFKKMFRFMN